jgi:hypothetical protein
VAQLEAQIERAVRALAAQDEPCAMDGWACGSEGNADCPADPKVCWRAYLAGVKVPATSAPEAGRKEDK